jgi:hypothetical protein
MAVSIGDVLCLTNDIAGTVRKDELCCVGIGGRPRPAIALASPALSRLACFRAAVLLTLRQRGIPHGRETKFGVQGLLPCSIRSLST